MLNAIRMSFAELHHWTAYASTMPSAEMIARDLEDGDESFRLGTKWLYALCDVDLDEVGAAPGSTSRMTPTALILAIEFALIARVVVTQPHQCVH